MKSIFNKRLVYSIITAVVLSAICLSSIFNVYNNSIEENYQQLHLQTKQFRKDIKLQLESDHENLITMSRFAEKLYENGEDFDLLYKSFKEIGLLSEIGVLLPNGTFITKGGETNVRKMISFKDEAKKGAYISGKVPSFTDPDKYIVRSSAPVRSNGDTIAILYGMTELKDLQDRYAEDVKNIDAHLYVFEADSGELLVDTVNPTLDNISILKNRKYKNGHTYNEMRKNIDMRYSGYTEFVARLTKEDLYVHYSPLGISDWYIMVARPTKIVFENARKITRILLTMFLILLFVGLIYILLIMRSERKISNLNDNASGIRKLLLEINHENTSIDEALRSINDYANARSVIFANTDGQLFKYTSPKVNKHFTIEEKEYFVKTMLEYARQNRESSDTDVRSYELAVNRKMITEEFDKFLSKGGIRNIVFTAVLDKSNHIGMIALLNPKNKIMAKALLEKIGVCFSMAIYNRKYLKNTEFEAQTDSLTGLYNRTAYKRDIKILEGRKVKNFVCVYVDANELHVINNTYGHAAGDEMLKFIAKTLKAEFNVDSVYRMGGDEFLVFKENTTEQSVEFSISKIKQILNSSGYHISTGIVFCKELRNAEKLVNEAETKMYSDKSAYYHKKGVISRDAKFHKTDHIKTGIVDLDKSLEIMSQRYSGLYSVNLKTDRARRLLMPSYLGYDENEEHFSNMLKKYITENASPDYHRGLLSFLHYDVIVRELKAGNIPRISYEKMTGEKVLLSIYRLDSNSDNYTDTIWVFENI